MTDNTEGKVDASAEGKVPDVAELQKQLTELSNKHTNLQKALNEERAKTKELKRKTEDTDVPGLQSKLTETETALEELSDTVNELISDFEGRVDPKVLQIMPKGLSPANKLQYLHQGYVSFQQPAADAGGKGNGKPGSHRLNTGVRNPSEAAGTNFDLNSYEKMSLMDKVRHLDEAMDAAGVKKKPTYVFDRK